ncbi:MAG: SpoIIE family protein phosphatase [Bacteroidetes bacterium]|nr:SpoIIE family protein phosphatase [Bacteroidota bacterium]
MRLLLLTIFLSCGYLVHAQDYYPPIVNYSTQQYGKDRNPEIWCAVQDKRGVMYFGTGNGVLEFDGQQWDFITVQTGAYVRAMAIDSSGVVYVGGSGEFGYLEPDETGQLQFQSLTGKLMEEDLFFFDIWKIHATRSEVFFQSQESLIRYDLATKTTAVIYPENSYHLSFMAAGNLYVRARQEGIQKFENGKPEILPGTELFKEYGLFGVFETADDSLLFVTQELGLWKWKNGVMRQLPELNYAPLNSFGIVGSIRLSEGSIALSTLTNGVIIIDENGKIKKRIDRSKGMRSNEVKSIFEDRDQNIWAMLGNGIAKVNYHSPLSYFNEKSGIEGNVEAVIRFNNRLYVGTSFGLFVQNGASFGSPEFVNAMVIRNQVWDFCVVDDELYIATSGGVYKTRGYHPALINAENITLNYADYNFQKLNDHNANVVYFSKEYNVFVIAGADGIFAYDRAFKELWASENISARFLSAEMDPEHKNDLWIGSVGGGVYRLRLGAEQYVIDQYSSMDGLNDDQLGKPILFNDRIIFGSSQGLLSFTHEDEMVKGLADSLKHDPTYYRGMFQGEPFYDSVFSAQILLVQQDKDRTWFCADDKIGYYDYQSKTFINKPFWGINYGRVNEFYLEENGVFWIGCADGLIRYEKNDQKKYRSTFYSLIREFSINRDSVIFNGTFADSTGIVQLGQSEAKHFELSYQFNDVYFRFSAPYFEDEHSPEFSFILEGHDDEWSEWSTKNDANFTNLHEGEYTFKVKARNIYGHISEEASFKFTVLPPWYRTTWAYVLYVVAFIIIFFIGVKISSARLKRQNQWLEGVVEERTREIKDKNEVLEHQKKEIQDSINYAKRIQLAILPLEDEMKKWMPDSFVLFRPKDVVSGDFYWFQEKDNKLIVVCADCTGHGVPGAFMSMIGSDRLNNIVNELRVLNPGTILSELSRAIKKSLKQDGEKGSTRDGMDAAICMIDLAKKTMIYAGANRPLWIVQDGQVEEIKANKVAVAGFTPDDQVFDEHEIPLKPGLKFYMTSDGYADQFGGEKGKKYMVKNMKEFILQHCFEAYSKQRDQLETELVRWMGDHEQIDDVCVIGFDTTTLFKQ